MKKLLKVVGITILIIIAIPISVLYYLVKDN